MLSWDEWLLIAAAGVLLTLAYPPFELVWPAFVCLVPAALLVLRGAGQPDPRRWRLNAGFWYGTVTHAVLLYWLAGALWSYGRGAVLLYVGAPVMFGGATAVMFAVVGRVSDHSPARLAVGLPAGIVLLEWLAGQVGPIALPWHQLALTLTSVPVLIQVADIAGAEGLGFLLAAVNALLALAWWERVDRRMSLRRVEAAATVLFLMALYGMHRVHTLPLRVAGSAGVVQPNVSVEEKWAPERQDAVVERTAVLAERAIAEGGVDLLVWPETALPDRLEVHPSWRARLMQLTRRSGAAVVSGGVTTAVGGRPTSRANAALSFDPGSDFHDPAGVIHRKRKLVPFVEAVRPGGPDLSRDRAGGFSPGRELALAEGPLGRFGVVICYELTFAAAARSLRRSGAGLLVVLSNDAWLGRSSASAQHFAHAVLRAVENRMAVVRSANTGVSGIVDPLGRVVTRTGTFEPAYAVGPVARAGVVPPAVWLGGLVGPAALALLLLLTVTCGHRRSSRDPRVRSPLQVGHLRRRLPCAVSPANRFTRPASGSFLQEQR